MAFENNFELKQTKAPEDDTHNALLADSQPTFMASGSRVDQPGIPHVPGKIYIPNPNLEQHPRPTSTISAQGEVRV